MDIQGRNSEYAATIAEFLAHCHRKKFAARQLILRAGEPSAHLYYVDAGSVTVSAVNHSGQEVVLAYLHEGDFFGEMGLFDKTQNRSAFVRARVPCDVAVIGYDKFKSLGETYQRLLFVIAAQISARVVATSRKVQDLSSIDAKGRVAKELLDLCRLPEAAPVAEGKTIRVSRVELAKLVGCSRENVARILGELATENLISVHGKEITVIGVK